MNCRRNGATAATQFTVRTSCQRLRGDITDRKTNAFTKHDRLIASIDTLKRPARIKRLLDAPRWDLVVFDEAHRLTAYCTGGKVRKTESYKLAESLKDHSRDLMLLSVTPHQGNHFQFWTLAQPSARRYVQPLYFLMIEINNIEKTSCLCVVAHFSLRMISRGA